MKKLSDIIDKLESNIKHYALSDPGISTGSVGWHIEHCLLVINSVIDALGKSIPGTHKNTFAINRSFVMITGNIPRGKVKAPTAVQPGPVIDIAALQEHILHSKEKLKVLRHLSSDHYFKHPFLGDFKLRPALRFINIHTKHHLKIMHDIIKSKR